MTRDADAAAAAADVAEATEDEAIPELFWGVARRLRHLTRDALEPWDITPSQSRALGVVLEQGGMRLSELAERLRIVPRSATEVVDALESRGLVERTPDPHDRRATLVGSTERGAAVGTAIREARGAAAEGLFGALSGTDRADLARILAKLRG